MLYYLFLQAAYYRSDIGEARNGPGYINCQLCMMPFATQGEISAHYAEAHAENFVSKGSFKCTLCDRKYTRSTTLREHIAKAHGSREKHVCNRCGRSYSWRTALLKHVKMCGGIN